MKNFGMMKKVLQNLFSSPATRMFPVEKRSSFKDVRGSIDVDIDKCIFCGLCQRRCPADVITVSRLEKSWTLDPFRCIICGVCATACPKKCIIINEDYVHPVAAKQKVFRQQLPASAD